MISDTPQTGNTPLKASRISPHPYAILFEVKVGMVPFRNHYISPLIQDLPPTTLTQTMPFLFCLSCCQWHPVICHIILHTSSIKPLTNCADGGCCARNIIAVVDVLMVSTIFTTHIDK